MFRTVRRFSTTLAEELTTARLIQYNRHCRLTWEEAEKQARLTEAADSRAEPLIKDLALQCVTCLNIAVDSRDRSRSAAKLLFLPNDSIQARHWTAMIDHLKKANYGVQNIGQLGAADDDMTFVVQPKIVKRIEDKAELRKIMAEHKKNSPVVLRVSLMASYPQ